MTISSVTSKVIYVGTGSTAAAARVFAYPFKIFADADLTVTDYNINTSTGTTMVLDTDYVVSDAGADAGGNVTLTGSYTALSTASWLVIQREMDLTQETDYVENDPFPAASHENALDKLTMVTQQLQEQVDRSIKADVAQTSSNILYTDFITQATAASSSATVAVAQASAAAVSATSAAADAALAASSSFASVRVSFYNASLSSGILDLTHSRALSTPFPLHVSVYDSAGYLVIPDNITGSTNTVHIDLSSFTVTGTWGVIYIT